MKIDNFKKTWDIDSDSSEVFKIDIVLDGIYAKYYQFLKETYKKNPDSFGQLNKHIVEAGLINIMKDIWTMFLANIAVSESSESFEMIDKNKN
jgi:hypothetical protein